MNLHSKIMYTQLFTSGRTWKHNYLCNIYSVIEFLIMTISQQHHMLLRVIQNPKSKIITQRIKAIVPFSLKCNFLSYLFFHPLTFFTMQKPSGIITNFKMPFWMSSELTSTKWSSSLWGCIPCWIAWFTMVWQ